MNARNIRLKTEKILKNGTRIVSFRYDGKLRNVLLGSYRADYYTPWGTALNEMLTEHNGKLFIAGVDNNDGRIVKVFDVAKIENPSF